MTTLEQGSGPPAVRVALPRVSLFQILGISLLWFAINLHWAAISVIILPSQVLTIVGDLNKGSGLAFILVPGAFVALFSNPLFGLLSDRTRGRWAAWGRRRPYIFIGTFVNVAALLWMASARDLMSLTFAVMLVQFSSNAIQAPFHALLPDLVPVEQRGLTSGVIGVLSIAGNIAGVVVAAQFVDSSKPAAQYQLGLWWAYGIIIAILIVLMFVTLAVLRERNLGSSQRAEQGREEVPVQGTWLSRLFKNRFIITAALTVIVALVVWGLMTLWNTLNPGLKIGSDVQPVVLQLIASVGLLRMFDFNPRRDPDFAWVFFTRLLMMLGIYMIQIFLQYYIRDVVGARPPELWTSNFIIIVSITSLISAFVVGWLSDHFGRKMMVYISGAFMAIVGLIFIVTHSLPIVLISGGLFGLGYGAYQSVDWALVADVLPSDKDYARDMGVWNISQTIPQFIVPVIGGPLIDSFTRSGQPVLGFQIIFVISIIFCVLGTVTVRYIKGVKR